MVLGTALITTISLAIALFCVFDGFQPVMLFVVPAWGLFILNLDRWLMSTTLVTPAGGAFRRLLPRLLLSVALRVCNPVPGTPEASSPAARAGKCDALRLAVPGDSPEAVQKELDDTRQQATELRSNAQKDAQAYADLEEQARRECNGVPGAGLTGRPGVGFNCRRLRDQAGEFKEDHRIPVGARVAAIGLPDANERVLWQLSTGDDQGTRKAFIAEPGADARDLAQGVVQ